MIDIGDDYVIQRSKIAGALYGVALGDALGRPTEFMDLNSIHKQFGRSGLMTMPTPALFTDDTQMTLRVANAMQQARSLCPRELARTLRQQFIDWSQRDDPRAPGVTCLMAIQHMKRDKKVPWTSASIIASKGCGANMRVAPTAFIRNIDTALGASVLQAAMTHGHSTAIAATELTALAIRWSAQDMKPNKLIGRLFDHAVRQSQRSDGGYRGEWLGRLGRRWPNSNVTVNMRRGWNECVNALLDLQSLLNQPFDTHPIDICKSLGGGGWIAEEALILGLYFAIRYQDTPNIAISNAARTSGDSDSIASIAGAIIGAYVGEDGWFSHWCDRIERQDEIERSIDVAATVAR